MKVLTLLSPLSRKILRKGHQYYRYDDPFYMDTDFGFYQLKINDCTDPVWNARYHDLESNTNILPPSDKITLTLSLRKIYLQPLLHYFAYCFKRESDEKAVTEFQDELSAMNRSVFDLPRVTRIHWNCKLICLPKNETKR